MSIPVYSSIDVSVSWGQNVLGGLAPDSFVTLARNGDLTDEEVGASGELAISRLPDRTGTCTISLQQGGSGTYLIAEVIRQQEESGTFLREDLIIRDPAGSVLAELTGCHVKTAPEITLGSTATGSTRDVVFFCERMKFTPTAHGVNPLDTVITDIKSTVQGTIDDAVSDIQSIFI